MMKKFLSFFIVGFFGLIMASCGDGGGTGGTGTVGGGRGGLGGFDDSGSAD